MLNFGSGPSAYAFDYEVANVNGVNLAMMPSAFGLEIALLKEYAPFFPRNGAAIFTVCPFSFGENQSNCNPWRYSRYYSVLSRKSIDSLPFPLPNWNENVAEKANSKFPFFPYGEDFSRDEVPSDDIMEERIKFMCLCWKSELLLTDFIDASQAKRHRDSFAREKKALFELIDTAQTISLRPFVLLPPLHSKLRKLISKELFDEFVTNQLTDIDVPILDYTNDLVITDNMFLGPVFLNRTGAKTLTESIWNIVCG